MGFLDFIPVVGDVIEGISNVAGASINARSQEKTNQQNYAMFKEQLGWNEDMWNKQNAYNTPAAQRERLEQAGLNPYLMLNGGSAGNAEMAQTASPSPLTAPQYGDALRAAGDSVGSAFSDYQVARMNEAKIEQVNTDNKIRAIDLRYKVQEKLFDLSEKRNHIAESNLGQKEKEKQLSLLDEQIYQSQMESGYLGSYLKSRNDRERNEANVAFEEYQHRQLMNAYQKLVNDSFPSLTSAQLKSLEAATDAAYADANLKHSMSEREKEEKALVITNNQIAKLRRDNVKVEQADEHRLKLANKRYIDAVTSKTRSMNNPIQNYSPLSGFAAAMVK